MLEEMVERPVSRREFLKDLVKAALGLAVSASVIGKASAKTNAERYQRRYDTFGHKVLDIEGLSKLGTNWQDYAMLDDIIDVAKERTATYLSESRRRNDAAGILAQIDKTLRELGFIYKVNTLLNNGLKTRKIDCDNYVSIYMGIADALNLPLSAVMAPNHTFIRWNFGDRTYMNWEPIGDIGPKNDSYFIKEYGISRESIENGAFMRSLSRDEAESIGYLAAGNELIKRREFDRSIPYLSKAVEHDPKNVLAHKNLGYAYIQKGNFQKALEQFKIVVNLAPQDVDSIKNIDNLQKYRKST